MKENCGCSLNKSIIKKVWEADILNPTRNCLSFQTSFPRQQNGTCTNGVLKNFSVNSDENERGVTFRVGKFIGQVTIESKLEIKDIAQNYQNLPSQTDQTTNFATKIKNTNTYFLIFFLIFHYSFCKQI